MGGCAGPITASHKLPSHLNLRTKSLSGCSPSTSSLSPPSILIMIFDTSYSRQPVERIGSERVSADAFPAWAETRGPAFQRREEGAVEFNMSVRDMDTLKHRISEAKSGTGQVAAVLASVTFKPRAAAFTSLIQSASRSKDAQKALEIFQCMQDMFHISPNTFSSSALISALAKSGQWQLAERYFHELESQATNDPQSRPNTVTYSALLTGARVDSAL